MSGGDRAGRGKILLLEDDDWEAKALSRAFSKANLDHQIIRVRDGIEGIEFLNKSVSDSNSDIPDILLVDLNMPRMSGLEFLSELRAHPKLRHMIAFVLTTSSDVRDIQAAYDHNIAGYIVKETMDSKFQRLIDLMNDYYDTVKLPILH
ncbi:MAG: response regulator [Mangrovicoccus sp.]